MEGRMEGREEVEEGASRAQKRRDEKVEKEKNWSQALSPPSAAASQSGQRHDETLAGSVSLGQSRLMISDPAEKRQT